MEELRDLQKMANNASKRFEEYSGKDFILPEAFKSRVRVVNSYTITYNKYSALVQTSGSQHGVMNIYMPNQWFYIASYFTELYLELLKYKEYALQITSLARLKELNGKNLSADETNKMGRLDITEESKEYLAKFITDYSWWKGAKTIDRGDFHVSPILACARLVNASQSFIVDLCAFLADKQDLVQMIINEETSDEQKESRTSKDASLQRIYYGAPGTGKSHTVNELTKGKSVVRTTFHPDSDYSTFVGCYKPSTIDVPRRDVTNKVTYEDGKKVTEKCIVYDFVPQAFLKAYIRAWKNYPAPQYLVIEEINRGNCAQIFGDLFQLLDRDENGFSKFPIDSDEDIKKHIAGEGLKLDNCEFDDKVKESICKGEIMLLPSNLYIWATMNTSDQSLFPIDSAFKRRWDWVYVPIANVPEKKWRIVIGEKECGWWDFLTMINERIGATTNSEDKKLGFFFCQAKNNVIDAETFVNKVLFYLWNDVFKDYGFENDLFKIGDKEFLSFDLFYKINEGETQVNADNVGTFLENLKVDCKEVEASNQTEGEGEGDDADDTDEVEPDAPSAQGERTGDGHDRSKYTINGEGNFRKRGAAIKAVEMYVSSHAGITSEQVLQNWLSLGIRQPSPFMLSETKYLERKANSRDPQFETRFIQVAVGGDFIYVSNQWKIDTFTEFADKVNQQDWGIHIEKVQE